MTFKVLLILFMSSLVYTGSGQFVANSYTSTVCADSAGCVRGCFMRGYNSFYYSLFEAFVGIPYALPPVGNLRFSAPRQYPKWNGTFSATVVKSDCIQKNYLLPTYPVSGSEDCLYLNVYRPRRHYISNKLPVMIYIYGGGWFSGTANPGITGPEYIMDTKEVILVTIAYRLGAFGFLSTGDEVMPGNFGLKDQLLAIKWVHKNIKAFGGDPENVTLFGQSVGAISAHMHILSPQSQGLFQRVIAMSGTANVPFAITENPLEQAIRTAKLCGIKNASDLSTEELLSSLRAVDTATIINAGDGLKFWSIDHLTNYRPVVEPVHLKDAFFTNHPKEIFKSGAYQPVSLMLGTVPNEGAVRALAIVESQDLRTSFNKDFFNILKIFLEFPKSFNEQQLQNKTKIIIKEYFNGEQELNNNTKQGFLDLITDRGFHHPYYNTIKDYVNTIDTQSYPIYLYNFNYTGPLSYSILFTGGIPTDSYSYGAVHCDDLIYLFRSPLLFPDFPKHSRYAKAMKRFLRNFVNFAKFGKPRLINPLTKCNNETFQRTPQTICDYQLFENDSLERSLLFVKIDNKFDVRRMHFWDQILSE